MKCKYEFCQMHILIVAATTFEILPIINLLKKNGDRLNGNVCNVLITGVGQVPATYALTTCLFNATPDVIIQAGIAGTFSKNILLGETVAVKQDVFGDLGMEEKEKFVTVFDAGFGNKGALPFTDGWLINDNDSLFKKLPLKSVKAVTVNKVSDSRLQKMQLINTFSPDVESMEGAAVHFVCLQHKIPFMQLRAISNEVGERDKSKWLIKDAIVNLNTALENFINSL